VTGTLRYTAYIYVVCAGTQLVVSVAIMGALLAVGVAYFRKTERGFADTI
jgi:ABC-type polysaccharide/polyol phosphate export permease